MKLSLKVPTAKAARSDWLSLQYADEYSLAKSGSSVTLHSGCCKDVDVHITEPLNVQQNVPFP